MVKRTTFTLPSQTSFLTSELKSTVICPDSCKQRITIIPNNMSLFFPSYKERRTYSYRVREVNNVLETHPGKVPIIIERFTHENNLPLLGNIKYLVPNHLTVGQLLEIIRRRLHLNPSQAVYLLVNGHSMACATMTMLQLYEREKDTDGFLYMVYASQEMFGCCEP